MSVPPSPPPVDDEAVMTRLGITRVPADQYHYKTFRYSKLSDAVAQAQRNPERDNSIPADKGTADGQESTQRQQGSPQAQEAGTAEAERI